MTYLGLRLAIRGEMSNIGLLYFPENFRIQISRSPIKLLSAVCLITLRANPLLVGNILRWKQRRSASLHD